MSKSNYQRLSASVLRRFVPWVFLSFLVLFLVSFIVHALVHKSIPRYFHPENLTNFFLFELWNLAFACYIIFQIQQWGGLLSVKNQFHQWIRNHVVCGIYSLFAVFLLDEFLTSAEVPTPLTRLPGKNPKIEIPTEYDLNWKELVLPLLITFFVTYYYLMSATIRPISSRTIPIHSNSLSTEISIILKNCLSKLFFRNLFYIFVSCCIGKIFTSFAHDIIIEKILPFFISASSKESMIFDDFYHLLDEEILLTTTIWKSILMIIIIQITCEFSLGLLYYILTMPLDFQKLQSNSSPVLAGTGAGEHILLTALTNFPTKEETIEKEWEEMKTHPKREFGKISLKVCLHNYQQEVSRSKNLMKGMGGPLHEMNHLPVALSQYIDSYYQGEMKRIFQFYKDPMNASLTFPILSVFSSYLSTDSDSLTLPMKDKKTSVQDVFAFFQTFQSSFFFMLRCHGWNDLNRIVYSGHSSYRKMIYENHWTPLMNDSFQLLTSFLLQVFCVLSRPFKKIYNYLFPRVLIDEHYL
jgi:hypothetical protein